MTSFPRIPVNWWGLVLRACVAAALIMSANMVRTWLFDTDNPLLRIATFGLTALVVLFFVAGWVRWVEGFSLRGLLRYPRGFLLGTAVILPLMCAVYLLYGALGYLRGEATVEFFSEYPTGIVLVISVLYAFVQAYVLQGFPEELIYRGWLAEVTQTKPGLTLAWTTTAFTVIHLFSEGGQQTWGDRLLYLVLPLGMGLLAGALRIVTGSLWAGVATHGGMHLFNSLVPPLVVPEGFPAAFVLLSGGAQAVAAVLILRQAGRRKAILRKRPA
ncbi:CPBP family intramembrane glutamic endopeptidase [Corynebacterium lowii]|uniref:CAAX amino terminal protease self-immunity n=1 Tax=Corynebacterium lowii TaxID=1544413 RepID=A0A0Q1AH74_9CORY|nr:CPBP family intramembrane glutamic endopeptidase [Corynebacterium lowii]KQB86017.1 CAAX amino terminal protease self- immunity [Corynebacterium lowii]MDP9850552.1 membrane protease YdiL (CAAX protease family) [Corynebacterium lowii]